MSHNEKEQQKEKVHEELQALLHQEITIRQALLANLTEQERLIMKGDIDLKAQMHLECKHIARKLQSQSRLRRHVTKELISLSISSTEHMTLECLLDPGDEDEAESLMLYEKLMLLTDKIHIQEVRNKTLTKIISKDFVLNQSAADVDPMMHSTKAKPFLLTIDYPEEKA